MNSSFWEVGIEQEAAALSALMINGGGESQMAGLPKIDGDKLGGPDRDWCPASLSATCGKIERVKIKR